MKYLWDRPGVGDDWESTWRSEAWRHLIEQGLRDAGLHRYTRQYQTNMACDVCSQKDLCEHKMKAALT